jgi:peptidoglycan/xylan/chitin deacetylase (PgdA/CDA1 family)
MMALSAEEQAMPDQVQQVVKWLAYAADAVRRPRGLVVLIYHRVGARTPVSVDLPRSLFAEQLSALATGWAPVTLDQAADLLAAPAAPPAPPPVCLTFDDGTIDFVEEALPELVAHRVPATLYVATDYVESGRAFPDSGLPVSWAGLRDALSTGLVTIGSHTHNHRLLDRVGGPEAADELDRSIGLIEDRLGVGCSHFAYPKALLGSTAAEQEVRHRFRTAAIGGTRPNPYGRTDLHRIRRSPVQVSDGMRWFRCKAAGGMALEDHLRTLRNRRRYAGSVT